MVVYVCSVLLRLGHQKCAWINGAQLCIKVTSQKAVATSVKGRTVAMAVKGTAVAKEQSTMSLHNART